MQHPNVLVMTTSNITDAIDLAFVDRADIKQYIGPPGPRVRYDILKTCVDELMRVGIVTPFVQFHSSQDALSAYEAASSQPNGGSSSAVSAQLYACAVAADGFSGRALRKLPFLAHTLCSSNAEVPAAEVYTSSNVIFVAPSVLMLSFSTSICCEAPLKKNVPTGKCFAVCSRRNMKHHHHHYHLHHRRHHDLQQ